MTLEKLILRNIFSLSPYSLFTECRLLKDTIERSKTPGKSQARGREKLLL